eukprot:NODE_434_length_1749_cov_463.011765_g365_i0.p1 GENE.NODE_434_length_1749_cov_463.011765_g365_i0~~NODE_434_length_1749_cov_463.011765_g365_i0.p1  ORF type:complete len:371 (-),score=96.47 NODE_434_length_1749_cov_463.011765_g365_i0:98-1210(-)
MLAWIAFGVGENDSRKAFRCPELRYFTNEKCQNREGVATAATVLDFLLGISGLTALVALLFTVVTGDFKVNRSGWREQERDAETEPPKKNVQNIKPHRVRQTRVAFTSVALIIVLLFAIAQLVLLVVLHQDHDTINVYSARGRSNRNHTVDMPWYEAGWSARNTRLRYAMSGIGILTVLLNLVPWRSRVVAYLFAFFYLIVFIMSIVCFSFDVHELREVRDENCYGPWLGAIPADAKADPVMTLPTDLRINCIYSPYDAAACLDMFVAVAILIYLAMEYLVRYKSIHSGRKYPWFQIRKVEESLDSRRPVRCEITNEVMTASQYYYRHRFLTEPEILAGAADMTTTSSSSARPYGYGGVQYDPVYAGTPM